MELVWSLREYAEVIVELELCLRAEVYVYLLD